MPHTPAQEPVRRAGPADVGPVAGLLATAGLDGGRPREQAEEVVTGSETWVVGFEQPRGVLVLDGDRIAALAVDPLLRGQGIGMRLVALAQLRRPGGVAVVPPADDERVLAFFARAGFVADPADPAGDGTLRWQP